MYVIIINTINATGAIKSCWKTFDCIQMFLNIKTFPVWLIKM